ncbi:hypothetical protein CANMA_002739 [Candida margitis]|uniref:uncharacterized protein n=1 Tax=Candida margitis TaxID=1775924 RepID=UPI0022273E12|nr:uncharacterized protein CANMA_002739 [Candida margitis]KAI5967971.1 hypothetical protein CANMA_002739 [Candida margitis]
MTSDSVSEVDVTDLLDSLFKDVRISEPTEVDTDLRLYPEIILQKSEKGNKLYASFQRYSPQFIKDGTDRNQVLRWRDSNIESAQRIILDSWIAQNSGVNSTSNKDSSKLSKSISTTGRANKLFVWSSSDSYIEEKKRLLQLRRGLEGKASQSHKPNIPNEDKPVETDAKLEGLQKQLHLKLTLNKVNNTLSKKIEIEANKFIHARIQKIRNHHSEQMMKQINDRKRKDHEVYLQRLKLKEEEYEKSLRQDQDNGSSTKKSNFFGTLFGLSGGAVSPISEVDSPTEPSNGSTTTPKSNTKSSKNKRMTLFGMQSLFSSGNTSKKRSDKTTMFDAEEQSDTQSMADSNLDHSVISASEEPEETESVNSPSIEDSGQPANTETQEVATPIFNVDELASLELKRSPQKSNGSDTATSRGIPQSRGTRREDEFDDEFTEFTTATSADNSNPTSPHPPRPPSSSASMPKLSHNFFSVEKANANATPAISGNELIDLFETHESRPTSPELNSPARPPLQNNLDNLLDL